MKPVHEAASTVITTPQQRRLIEQLAAKHLEEGGSMLCQVFPDGLRLRVLTPQATADLRTAFAKALGEPSPKGLFHSAFSERGEGGAA